MSGWRFVIRSLFYHWRINATVAFGVAAATAVLTGALLVGDSVRGSLRRLTLDRLGGIEQILLGERFFRADLASELSADAGFAEHFATAVPVILFPHATLEQRAGTAVARASQVTVIGSAPDFWAAGQTPVQPRVLPAGGEIVLNEPLATELGACVGDQVSLRLPKSNLVPADSPLGRRVDRTRNLPGLKVVDIIPAEGLGAFSWQTSQATPRNAYVAIQTLESALQQPGQANALLVLAQGADQPASPAAKEALDQALRPSLADYGLAIRRIRQTYRPADANQEETAYDYFDLTTGRLLFEPAAEQAVEQAWGDQQAQPLLTYLATSLAKAGAAAEAAATIPYSLVTAVDSRPPLGPLPAEPAGTQYALADDEIALNSWAASDLQARLGDRIQVTFFEPETTHGALRERTVEFTLKTIVPLTEPATPARRNRPARYRQRPGLANDPDLTPTVEGLTDQDSISKWDAPFPVDARRVRRQDDVYWQNHRTTPKAFVSLAAGRKLWGSRFGQTTSFRIPTPLGLSPGSEAEQQFVQRLEDQLLKQLDARRGALGFAFLPVRMRGLAASQGATPFGFLFLGLSFFVIAAAVLLVALLFRLGIERRAEELGLLLALGLGRRQIGRWLLAEGSLVALAGGAIGVGAGLGYAWLMLAGLRTLWLGAVQMAGLELYHTSLSLWLGYFSGVAVSAATIAWSLRRIRGTAVSRLLAGEAATEVACAETAGRWGMRIALGLLVVAIGLAVGATRWSGETQAGAFVGSGALMLTALLLLVRNRLRSRGVVRLRPSQMQLITLALQNAGRNPGRSTASIALIAVASFLIIAMSAFRLVPSAYGTGGFDLIAESSEPVFGNLNQLPVRQNLLPDNVDQLAGTAIFGFRVQPGDDASCNNLYRAAQPRVLGVTEEFIRHFDATDDAVFAWAAHAAPTPAQPANPWRLLASDASPAAERAVSDPSAATPPAVSVILDQNTALYSLQLYGGIGEQFDVSYGDGRTVRFRVVGLLANSILQGSLLVSERDFVQCFPTVSGYRFFLIRSEPGQSHEVANVLEAGLSEQGFDAVSADARLADLLAVQNTYLSTFQSLGALGLLLGTFGLAAVQARNVLERRRELALLRAVGFRLASLARLVMYENLGLLLGGLATGCCAALLVVLPHWWFGGASIPWLDLGVLLGSVLVVGLLVSLAAVRTTLRAPVLAALRGD